MRTDADVRAIRQREQDGRLTQSVPATGHPLRPGLPPLPPQMRHLPVSDQGYPVPWFVSWVDGKPEFRAADGRKFAHAVQRSLCWVCGTAAGPHYTFVIGPMCAVNRTTAEPPCHRACAEFSARACPFLSKPHMTRREGGLPADACNPAGHMIRRNPGVTCLWTTRAYRLTNDGRGGLLFELLDPMRVDWFAEGRTATRAEVEASVGSGLPLLREMAEKGGPDHLAELERLHAAAARYYPAA